MPLNPKKRAGHTEFDQEFLKTIDEHGWHVMNVAPRTGQEGDLWSYSTGLFYRYKHPEIVIFNQLSDLRHSMINSIGNRVKAGETFEPGKGYADIIGNFDVQFRPMHASHYWDWLNLACWFYDNDPNSFPVLQCFYPDMQGKFPWEAGCEQWAIDQQPFHDQPKPADIEKS
jgi:uncharacterized protein DUF4262